MHRRCVFALALVALADSTLAQDVTGYKVLATTRTATMQKEMAAAAAEGYRFVDVMGGETAFGGNEVVTLMQRTGSGKPQFEYRLLATSRTSTMQQELQEAANSGFDFVGQTVFESLFGGREVTIILERDAARPAVARYEYRLVATSRTSTLQKELDQLGQSGYQALAMTVGKTAVGGAELVVISRRLLR